MKLLLLLNYRAKEYKRTLSWIKEDGRVYFVNLEYNERVRSYENSLLEESPSVVALRKRS